MKPWVGRKINCAHGSFRCVLYQSLPFVSLPPLSLPSPLSFPLSPPPPLILPTLPPPPPYPSHSPPGRCIWWSGRSLSLTSAAPSVLQTVGMLSCPPGTWRSNHRHPLKTRKKQPQNSRQFLSALSKFHFDGHRPTYFFIAVFFTSSPLFLPPSPQKNPHLKKCPFNIDFCALHLLQTRVSLAPTPVSDCGNLLSLPHTYSSPPLL